MFIPSTATEYPVLVPPLPPLETWRLFSSPFNVPLLIACGWGVFSG